MADFQPNWLNWFHFLILAEGSIVVLIGFMIFMLPFLVDIIMYI